MKTQKRILAFFLAVVLSFSALPFSVSAETSSEMETVSDVSDQLSSSEEDETGTGSGLEEDTTIQVEIPDLYEDQLEESTGGFIGPQLPDLMLLDYPTLYAQDNFNTVKNSVEGGTEDMTKYGLSREAVVSELKAHESDNFYKGTTYKGGDWQSPNGDTSYNGSVGMNCGGFVSYVLRKAGMNAAEVMRIIQLIPGNTNNYGSGKPYDILANADNFKNLVENGNVTAYAFRTKQELLSSGLAEKGDIILMYWSKTPGPDGADNHIGFYWGNYDGEDLMWHSSDLLPEGNGIGPITPKTAGSYYILIKLEIGYDVTLTKTSADVSVTGGNNAYSLEGAVYNVYEGSSASGSVVATFTTDSSGHATINPPLKPGSYSVKEIKPPKGYKLDETIYTFQITHQEVELDVQDDPGLIELHVIKKDADGNNGAQGNASLAGAVYRVSYQKNGQTVTEDITSDENGDFPIVHGIPFGKVTVQEIKAPPGYKLDTEIHEYYIDGSKLVDDTYELVPDDIVEEVQKGGVTIQKKDSQTGTTPQGNASLAGISFEIINKSDKAVVVNGKTAQPGEVAITITTNASGVATTGSNTLPYGDYTIRESSTNSSMLLTWLDEIDFTIDSDGKVLEYEAENDVVRGGIEVEKQDSQTGSTPQGNASFEGIDFEVVNSSANPVVVDGQTYNPGEVVMTITTGSDGVARTGDNVLPYGRYTVRESATNESMLKTFTQQTVDVHNNGQSVSFVAKNDVERGGLSLQKQDTITGNTPQGDADFEGITFQIINNSRNPVMVEGKKYNPGEVVKTLVTDSQGKASTSDDLLPYGEYILHESATNESMLNTVPDQTVLVEDDGVIYTFDCPNEVVRGDVLIEKRDLESGLLTPLGGASLDGTLFEITNLSKNAVYVNGALYEPGEVCATIVVEDGIAQTKNRALPYGTYQMVETVPGEGYLHTDKKVRDFKIRKDGEVIEFRGEANAAYNQVIRGDLQFIKVGEDNMHRFANVAFKLISETTGETHIVVTDENGEVRTSNEWNPHSQNTNGNDDIEDESLWDDHAGVWFGQTTEGWIVDTQDVLYALPYDTYTIEELRCEANEGYELVIVPHVTISRNNTVIELGTIDDLYGGGDPEIGTTASVNGDKNAAPASSVTITDVVQYSGLTVGKTYTLKGVLMDKETGEKLLVDGKEVTAEKEFKAGGSVGTEEVTFTFDASALNGKSVVVFEKLYEEDREVAAHEDIEDVGQTVTFAAPELGTTATVDGQHTAEAAGKVTIVDTVSYNGLTVGQTYTIKGVLMDKATEKPLLVNDEQVTAEATFVAPAEKGTVDIPFTFDASGMSGKVVVVFETLYKGGLEVAAHADLEDQDQTVTFGEPSLGTTATVNGSHSAEPAGEVTLVDKVAYTGLSVGKTYTVSGVLMDKATEEPLLIGGKKVTSEVQFIAEKSDGTVEVPFTFDASSLAGKSVVVFETVSWDGKEVAAHKDINDAGQTVSFGKPEIGTTATVGDGEKETDPLEKITITDVVQYSGLIPGKEYTLSGILMDKATGKPLLVDGEEVTAEKTFVASAENGTVEITFTLDASDLSGTAIVVFETLYKDGKEVAAHTDINDEDQTVTVNVEGIITGTKTDTDGNLLEGALFGLFAADETEFTEDTALAVAETDENGVFTFPAIPAGDYLVVELMAPDGYVRDDTPIEVVVDSEVVELDPIENNPTKMQIIKVDAVTGSPLTGATLELYDPDGTLLDSWVTNGTPHEIIGVPVDTGYVLKEISAPRGYEIADAITFDIKDTEEVQIITMKDQPRNTTTTPQTGDTGIPSGVYLGVLVGVLVLGGGYVIYRKRNSRR